MNLLHLYRNERFIVFLEKVKKVFYKVLPQYAILSFIIIIGMNVVTYYGSQLITNHLYHYDVTFLMPNDFPLIPSFIYIYILAYVQWIVGYIIIARENKKVCYEILSAEFIAKFLCLICFFRDSARRLPVIAYCYAKIIGSLPFQKNFFLQSRFFLIQ